MSTDFFETKKPDWVGMQYAHFTLVAKFKKLGLEPIPERTFGAVEEMEQILRNYYDKADKTWAT
jgi:hypothetical protein